MTALVMLNEMLFLGEEDKCVSPEFDHKLSKCYLTAYKAYALKQGYNLKRLNFTFVAPSFSNNAYQTAYFFNNAIKNIANVDIKVNLLTIEKFINDVLELIPDSKWFIKTQIPALCVAKAKVFKLKEEGLATVI